MSIDLTRFYESFFVESMESLDTSEQGLLALERGNVASDDELNAIFRGLHSVKGAAGSLGFTALADFTHHLEGALDRLRKREIQPTRETLDALLAGVDFSRALVLAARDGRPIDETRGAVLTNTLRDLGHQQASVGLPAAKVAGVQSSQLGYRIRFSPHSGFFATGNDPLRILKVLADLAPTQTSCDLQKLAEASPLDPEQCYLSWVIETQGDVPRSEIEEVFAWVKDDCDLSIEPLGAQDNVAQPLNERVAEEHVDPPSDAELPAHAERRAGADRRAHPRPAPETDAEELRQERLHVSRDKVDVLINLVGELVITKTMLKESMQSLPPEASLRLETVIQQLERNTRDLQESVMAIRMLPVSHAFGRFSRLVRDVGHSLGKQVELVVTGEQSELDKTVIEKLVDPLTHLVRNALDHGIETPGDRKAAGKVETATLKLHAEHKGGNIEIVVSDDGRGINAERVFAKARMLGLVEPEEPVSLERACGLIFEPGFSTSEAVNELSGRGVGLDVVRRNIISLSGGIRVETAPGQGTAFVIRLPLTLAIIDGMTVTVGNETYIVPMTFIAECVQPDPRAIKTVAGRGMLFELRGQYLPLLKLGELIGLESYAGLEGGILLVVEADGNRVALLVDSLVGQEQVVIKSLESNFRRVEFMAGATILGQGQVVLILDVAALVRAAKN
jgi:two-component system, chemotaxis family, sensor kinase CheA